MEKPTTILAIDPGPEMSAWILYNGKEPGLSRHQENALLEQEICLAYIRGAALVYEEIVFAGIATLQSMGHILKTSEWIGRFKQTYHHDANCFGVTNREIRLHLCGTMRANGTAISAALYDRYGGYNKAVGGKKCETCKGKCWRGRGRAKHKCETCSGRGYKYPPGPMHGMNKHVRSAYAVAVTWWETRRDNETK